MICKHNRIIKELVPTGKKSLDLTEQYEEIYQCAHCGCTVICQFVGTDSTVQEGDKHDELET